MKKRNLAQYKSPYRKQAYENLLPTKKLTKKQKRLFRRTIKSLNLKRLSIKLLQFD